MKKKSLFLFFFFFLFSFSTLYSQTTIKGFVKDHEDSLLFGNVLLLSPVDSSLIKGAYYEFGTFSITNDLKGPALLKITSWDFEDLYIPILANQIGTIIELGEIKMAPLSTELGTVTVTASIPIIEKSPEGGLVVNVEKTILGSSTSLLEIFSKLPSVTVNGNIVSVVGRGEALLYLDGKRITFEQLGAISVPSVQKVEIISNPSAKYDAEGRAIINIKLLPNPRKGFEISIIQNATFARHFLYAPALTVNYRNRKFSLKANYSLSLGKDWTDGTVTRDVETANGTFSSSKNELNNNKSVYVGNHSIGAGYQFNQNHGISFEYSGLYNLYDLDILGDNVISTLGTDISNLKTNNYGKSTDSNNSYSLNYNGVFDTLGSSIFFGAMSSDFTNNLNGLIDERIFENGTLISEATRNNRGFNNIALNTAQIDISKNFRNGMVLEFGAKYGDARNQSKIDLYSKSNGGEFILDSLYSNEFTYKEKIPAVYAQLKGTIGKKINYSIGARSEYSMVSGFSSILNETVLDTNYLNVFPNAVFNFKQNDNWSYKLSYTSRISRPKYQDLDPFLWYQDSLTSIQGNPFIKPELIHGGELAVQRKEISLTGGYFYSVNPARFVIFPGNTGNGSVIMKRVNLEAKHSFVTTLSIPIDHKFYTSYNYVSLEFNKFVDSRPEYQVGAIVPQLYVYSYNQFKIKNWFNIEVIIDYEGANNDGLFQNDHRYSLSAGLSKYLLDGNLTLRFLANDALRSYHLTGSSRVGQVSSTYDARVNSVFYRFSIIYSFGKLKEINYNIQNTSTDELDRLKLKQ
ncbi:MAG: TonB-dependent receptor domain-containing protein [Fluviicola sp.]